MENIASNTPHPLSLLLNGLRPPIPVRRHSRWTGPKLRFRPPRTIRTVCREAFHIGESIQRPCSLTVFAAPFRSPILWLVYLRDNPATSETAGCACSRECETFGLGALRFRLPFMSYTNFMISIFQTQTKLGDSVTFLEGSANMTTTLENSVTSS